MFPKCFQIKYLDLALSDLVAVPEGMVCVVGNERGENVENDIVLCTVGFRLRDADIACTFDLGVFRYLCNIASASHCADGGFVKLDVVRGGKWCLR